jgi:hypothetical protein
MRTGDLVASFICRTCEIRHIDLPLCFGPDAPASWEALPEHERSRRGKLTDELCEIDGQHFFIRGRIEIPIQGNDNLFVWLAWSSLSEANFQRARDLWCAPGREHEKPYFGWLNSALPGYPSTLNLKLLVHTRRVGERPRFELEPTDHPLSVDQRNGISWQRVHEIGHRLSDGGA